MAVVHKKDVVKEVPTNLPNYRGYASCTCGFETRQTTVEVAESQLNEHLANHGVIQSPLVSPPAPVVSPTGTPTGTWKPLGSKR